MAYDPITGKYTSDTAINTSGAFQELANRNAFNPLSGLRPTTAESAVNKANTLLNNLEPLVTASEDASTQYAKSSGGSQPSGNQVFQMLNGILYYGGKPFSGVNGKTTYANGLPQSGETTAANALKSEAQIAAEADAAARQANRQSAYDLLYSQFSQYGLESLVDPLKGLITSGASPAEFTIKLRESDAYKKRFAGNAQRIANGLTAVDEATYLAKEDAYQNLMRNYGLPQSYWAKDSMGTQEGFTKLIANDVSAVELEGRLQAAQNRVINANPEVAYALKAFYPDINNGDILAYALDPKNALDNIKRKVTAAEIGGAALSQGLTTSVAGAENLAGYGITKEQAQQGYQSVAGVLPRGGQLASIYGENPYTQSTAEAEVFGTLGSAEARKQREKLVGLEKGSFAGSSGMAGGALSRDRASSQGVYRSAGAGSF